MAANSEYTSTVWDCTNDPKEWSKFYAPDGGTIDFQVRAFTGVNQYLGYTPGVPPIGGLYGFVVLSTGNWSQTQTLTIPTGPNTPSNTPPFSPTLDPDSTSTNQSGFLGTNLPIEYGYVLVVAVMVVVVLSLAAIAIRRQKKVQI